jgi:hypothetical protein
VDGRDREAIEREAAAIFRAARADPAKPPPPQTLVTRLLGIGSVRVVPASVLPVGGAIARVGDRWRVYLRAGIPSRQARFTVLHELAHWALGSSATEDECDALAARLLAPREAFELAMKREGKSFTRLARWFGCTETFAALRYGEVTDEPLVVVAPASVRIRGREWSWPAEQELRGLVKARRLPGLRKARLRDDPRRVALSRR